MASQKPDMQERATRFLYETVPGRAVLKVAVSPVVSKAAGAFLSTPLSKPLVKPFVKGNGIDLSQVENTDFKNYNECFSRKLVEGARPICDEPGALVSPADSRLSVLPITEEGEMTLKGTPYTVKTLLRSKKLARKYQGGYAFVFRLCVDDYHRYCFPADGVLGKHKRIKGVLHTVSPIANAVKPIYKENTREYTLLKTKEFGPLILMEVGALLVGKIVNHPLEGHVSKGQEKGFFQFGGSTVVVLVPAGRVKVSEELLQAGIEGIETRVRYGQKVAEKLN